MPRKPWASIIGGLSAFISVLAGGFTLGTAFGRNVIAQTASLSIFFTGLLFLLVALKLDEADHK